MCKVIYKDEYTNATGLIAECETLEKKQNTSAKKLERHGKILI